MLVSQILKDKAIQETLRVAPGTTVGAAANLLSEKKIGGVLVADSSGGRPSAETNRQSNSAWRDRRLAARRGSEAAATHISEEPGRTRMETAAGGAGFAVEGPLAGPSGFARLIARYDKKIA